MNLVRFGSIYINFDRVAVIRDLTPGPSNGPRLLRLEFTEGHLIDVTAHATELQNWINAHSDDITAQSPTA